MIYKFDILFKKRLSSGGVKVVTYSSLLENPEAFGPGEGFADAVGELSMVLEGPEDRRTPRRAARPRRTG